MTQSNLLIRLSWLVAVVALFTAATGLFWQGDSAPAVFTSVHQQSVPLYGQGLYRNDSLLIGAGFRGTDAITLFVCVPLLLLATLLYRRGSLRGGVLLTGMLSYFLYNGTSLAFGAAYNPLFLAYIALFSSSFFAFVLAFSALNPQLLQARLDAQVPTRSIAIFLLVTGPLLLLIWLSDALGALAQGRVPDTLAHYTTVITYALDLGIIAPALILTGVLLLKRVPLGALLVVPLLTLGAAIGLVVLAQTAAQVIAGVSFTVIQLLIFSVSFMLLALFALRFLLALLSGITGTPEASPLFA